MAACLNCVIGSLDDGQPQGEKSQIAGVPCYISKPSSPSSAAIILATDVFGYKLPNARFIADVFAENGFLCVVPDYLKGDPVSMDLLLTYESLPDRSLLGKLGCCCWLAWTWLGVMACWFRKHPIQPAVQLVAAAAAELRQQHGVSKVGLQGYCYGGLVGVLMSNRPETLDAICSAHPGGMRTIPDKLKSASVPLLFICPERDAWFPEKTKAAAQKMLQEIKPGLAHFLTYLGTRHGFAVRGSRRDAAVAAARRDALQQGVAFFEQHLLTAGQQQQQQQAGQQQHLLGQQQQQQQPMEG